jgi:hypothetical protein
MIANTIPRIIARISRRSSTGNALAWLDRRSGSYMTPQVLAQQTVIAPLSNPVAQSSGLNHNVIAHRRRWPGRSATIKSP